MNAGPLDIPKTIIKGKQTDHELSLDFLGYHDGEKLMNVNTKLTGDRERLVFTVSPDSLILNKEKWTIPQSNEMVLTDKNLEFNDFKITKNNQSIELTDKFVIVAFSGAQTSQFLGQLINFQIYKFEIRN